MSVERAQAEINSQEFAEWMAYYSLEPFGEERADLRAGIISCTIASTFRGKSAKRPTPADFMPQFDKQPAQRQSGEEIVEQLKAIFGR